MNQRILIVDDEPQVTRGYRRSLRKQFSLDVANSGEEAIDFISQSPPYAVVVSDMRMPGMSGLQLLTELKTITPGTVRIMLTGNADQQTAVDAVNTGKVFKFLTKPCSPQTLARALQEGFDHYATRQQQKQSLDDSRDQVHQLTKKLHQSAQRDYLTGLWNRSAFGERLDTLLPALVMDETSHSVCMLDIDKFHVINDSCGHIAGDECLRQFSSILSTRQRSGDLVARLSDNRFGLFFCNISIMEAEQMCRELLELFRQYRFSWRDQVFDINVSIGLAPINATTPGISQLLSELDTACNVAKDKGGNQLHVCTPEDGELTRRIGESQWVSRIQLALEQDRFALFYQTISPLSERLESGEHFEILIRLIDEEGDTVKPGQFLGAAENHMLSPQIDRWVVKNVATWFATHPQQLSKTHMCSINLSGHSLGNTESAKFIISTFQQANLPPDRFCFEITETAAIANLNAAIEFTGILRQSGFRFSLDDFGTGLSSFAYLKNFPVDYLKIDGQFVKNIAHDPVDRAMVKSINEVGKIMGKQTIAEFVENQQISQILGQLGVDFAQGYHIGKPKPLTDKGD